MRAHAPGSITGLFAPPPGDRTAGSRGASFAIEDGVAVEVEPAEETAVTVGGDPAPFAPVEGVLDRLGVRAAVAVEPEVPLGNGFGASGAATLATAVAADAAFDLGRPRGDLLEAAHLAEVEAGTGLGDVFIQDTGGLRWTVDGERKRLAVEEPVEYVSHGPVDTSEALADPELMAHVTEVGTALIDRLPAEPTMREVTALSWEFARRTGLVTDRVERDVERVEAAGGLASMAMLGETVFAVGVEGALERRTRVSNRGARLV